MKVHDPKRKSLSLFQSNYIKLQLVVSSITSWKYRVQAVPLKKKNLKRERGKENEMEKEEEKERGGKEEKKKKRMESVCAKGKEKGRMRCGKKRRKGGRENEKEGEGEERRRRERRVENRERSTRSVLPSPDTFPSTKLGNNITPIKGILGKNTTPTSRDPTELNQNP